MPISMVQVRVVWMPVPQCRVPVSVGVRLGHWPIVLVPVVLVEDVPVLMLQLGVDVLVLVSLGKVQPKPDAH